MMHQNRKSGNIKNLQEARGGKRLGVAMMLLCAVLGLAGCGSQAAEETTTAEATVQGTQVEAAETTAEPSSAEIERNSVYATVQELSGTKLTVEAEDGKTMTFDISRAETNPAYEFMQGDEVEIEYLGSEPIDGMAVSRVVMSTPYEMTSEEFNEDGILWGTIVSVDDQSITVQEDDGGRGEADGGTAAAGTYTFTRAPYEQVITKDGLNPGAAVLVSYVGELDAPTAYRLCTEDMQEDPAGDIYAMSGTVDKIEQGVLYLSTADGTVFKFAADDSVLAKAQVGASVTVDYYGSIRQRVIQADDIH